MAKCSHCNQEISCPQHQHTILGMMPCEAQSAAIWVRAIDEDGASVPGVVAETAGKRATTLDNGFAKLEGLDEAKHTVTLSLDERAALLYLAPDPDTRKESVRPGDLKLLAVKLRARVQPRLTLSATFGHVGDTLTLTLETDRRYVGRGTLRCTKGQECIVFDPLRPNDAIDFAGTMTLRVKLETPSALDGIVFEWSLDPAFQRGPADTKAATAVRVALVPHTRTAQLADDVKAVAPGLIVHLQDPGSQRRRAQIDLVVTPPELVSHVMLAAAGDGEVLLWTQAVAGVSLDVRQPVRVPVGPEHPRSYFLEGTKTSEASGDVELTVTLADDPAVRDAFVVTVVQVTLTAHAGRDPADLDADPVAIAEDQKLHPGTTLVREVGRHVQRRKLVASKRPADAPCKVRLVGASGVDAAALFGPAELVLVSPVRNESERLTFENRREREGMPLDLRSTIDLDTIIEPEGWTFWLAGTTRTTPRGVVLQLDIDDVDVACDAVAYTIVDPALTVELRRSPNAPLAADVDIRVREADGTKPPIAAVIPAGGLSVAIEVPAGHYIVEVAPRDPGEAAMRVVRTQPESSDAAVAVLGPTTARFELRPAYTHVQPISYWVKCGDTPRGIDASAADSLTREANADADMRAKAGFMLEAIRAARTAAHPGDVDPSPTTLKVFMAPEFFFRGAQGAYPLATLTKIMAELTGEIGNALYDDWLFVLGTAVGVVEAPTPVVDPAKRVGGTIDEADFHGPVPAFQGMASPHLWKIDLEVTYAGAHRPAVGWAMTSPAHGTVVSVGVKPPNTATVSVHIRSQRPNVPFSPQDVAWLKTQAVTFEEPVEAEIVNVAIIRKGGAATPTGRDGRGLRELMVEKDYVAWADLTTPIDSGQGAFFEHGHQLVNLFGQLCRAKPPAASFMAHRFGWPNPPPVNTSEVNTSGSGGGSLFTVDRVNFGLEICMDHGLGSRLIRYFFRSGGPGSPQWSAGDPLPQVLLIPAGGMQITPVNVYTVAGGVVFNVDTHTGPAARFTTAAVQWQTPVPMNGIAPKGPAIAMPTDASAHFTVYFVAGFPGNGQVQIYATTPLPPAAFA